MPENEPGLDALLKPLQGIESIRGVLGWSAAKFYRKLEELKRYGVVWYEWHGRPPRKVLCSYAFLLIGRYKIPKGARGEVL